ncbi:MAG: hypothetical protein COA73_04810 [Candidatus Hydrogenedentota bacterium]|nr:MAG: hypothetical protein COA73_04810 [Candidatus Hydrogenedentota bacterium]
MNFGFIFPYENLALWGGAALAVLILIGYVFIRLERQRAGRLGSFIELRLVSRLFAGVDRALRKPLLWLTLAGFTFMAITFAQPHWGKSLEPENILSHDILVVLDVSESMLAENPLPNRLERAKQKIEEILSRSKGDRVGLIAFSGAAELMCPFTRDLGYFMTVLNAVDTDSISFEGTDIASALELAIATFQDQDDETLEDLSGSRAILLISDGEEGLADNSTKDLIATARLAGEYARVFVIGVGDPRGAEVMYSNRLGLRGQFANQGQPHISKLDEATLSKIALEGRGGYIRSSANNSDVDEMHGLIQQLFTQDATGDVSDRLVNRYQWPLALAFVCFLMEGVWLAMLPLFRKEGEAYPADSAQEKTHA